jgi:hypothetical protein
VKRARFVSVAAHEFLAGVAYYEEARPGHGARFIAAVQQAAPALAFPLSGSPVAAGTRRVLVRAFPFSIVYRADAEGIIVFAVAHSARQPGYWGSRAGHDSVSDLRARWPSAARIRSSQSRVAKMESGDSTVSIDLLVRTLLALGASRRDLAKSLI